MRFSEVIIPLSFPEAGVLITSKLWPVDSRGGRFEKASIGLLHGF